MTTTQEIPLYVVYQRIEATNQQEDSVSVDMSSVSSVSAVHNSVESLSSDKSFIGFSNGSLEQNKEVTVFKKVCAILGITVAVLTLVWLVLVFSVTFMMYNKYDKCINSKHFDNKTVIFYDANIEKIDLQVVSGTVDIRFHHEPYLVVDVKNKYRDVNLIDRKTLLSQVFLRQGIIHVTAETPAFNIDECQYSEVSILLPIKYQRTISITGTLKTGFVHLHGHSANVLDNVDISVEAGSITAKKFTARSLLLNAEFGYIKVADTIATDYAKILTHTGSIHTHDLITKDFQAVTKFGYSYHNGITADKVIVETKIGFSSIYGVVSKNTHNNNVQEVIVITEYGKSVVALENNNVDFRLESNKGKIVVDYEEEEWECKLKEKSHSGHLMSGKCDNLLFKQNTQGRLNLNIDTEYGNSVFIVDKMEDN